MNLPKGSKDPSRSLFAQPIVWTEQHKLYTPFLPRAPRKESNETKQKSCSYSYLSNKRTCPLIREVRVRAYCPTKYIYCVWEPHISSDILCIFFSFFYFLRATFIDQFGQLDASGVRIFIAFSQKCQKMLFKMGQKEFVSCIWIRIKFIYYEEATKILQNLQRRFDRNYIGQT